MKIVTILIFVLDFLLGKGCRLFRGMRKSMRRAGYLSRMDSPKWNITDMQPLSVSVEGIFGAGKARFLHELQREILKQKMHLTVKVAREPFEAWKTFGPRKIDLVDRSTIEPAKYASSLVTAAVSARMEQMLHMGQVHVSERSLQSILGVFIPRLAQEGHLTEIQQETASNLIRTLEFIPGNRPHIYIYLRADPSKAGNRAMRENREDNWGTSVGSLADLHMQHERWLIARDPNPLGAEVWVYDVEDRWPNVPEIFARIMDRAFITPI